MLMSFRLTLPPLVQNLVTVQKSASAVVEQTLSFDCTAGSRRGLDLFFLKQTLAVTLPLFLPSVAIPWVIAHKLKKKGIKYLSDKIFCSIVVLYYLVFPAIVSRVAITFACTKYGDDGYDANKRYIMQRSLSTPCYNSQHLAHILMVTVPAICLYLVLFPLYLTLTMIRLNQKKVLYVDDEHFNPRWTYRFGFLFAGYEPKYGWWEMVVLFRKALFSLVTVFARPAGVAAQVMSAVLVLVLSLSAHIHLSPYDHDTHDHLESASLHASLITLPVALLANEMSRVYGTGKVGEGGEQMLGLAESMIFTIVAFATFIVFVYFFFHGIVLEAQHNEKGLLRTLSLKVCRRHAKHSKSKQMRKRSLATMNLMHVHPELSGLDVDELFSNIQNSNTADSKKSDSTTLTISRRTSGKLGGRAFTAQFQTLASHAVILKTSEDNVEVYAKSKMELSKRKAALHAKSRSRLAKRLSVRNKKYKKQPMKISPAKQGNQNEVVSALISPKAARKFSENAQRAYKKVTEKVARRIHKKCISRLETSDSCLPFSMMPQVLKLLQLTDEESMDVIDFIREEYYFDVDEKVLGQQTMDVRKFVEILLYGLSMFAPVSFSSSSKEELTVKEKEQKRKKKKLGKKKLEKKGQLLISKAVSVSSHI